MQLKTYYEFCTELETALTSILSVLCSADMTAMAHLEMHQVKLCIMLMTLSIAKVPK